ncbi:hypothetical protein DFS34DRAFT_646048 [Phlyctochytrium arcticum]|nr:hypothetical protein DFS34DRAFT_646048 [Phlyctochytrium arcticum]
MFLITSVMRVLSIWSQTDNNFTVILAFPTLDDVIELEATMWKKEGRIATPEIDLDYFCVAGTQDPLEDKLQVFTFHHLPLPEEHLPAPAQVSVTGVIATTTEDTVKILYRIYAANVESWRPVLGHQTGGWKLRQKVLTSGNVIQAVGELTTVKEFEVANFYLTGASTKVPGIMTTQQSPKRAAIWGRKRQTTSADNQGDRGFLSPTPSSSDVPKSPTPESAAVPVKRVSPKRKPLIAHSIVDSPKATPKKRGRPRKIQPVLPVEPIPISVHDDAGDATESDQDSAS